MEARIREALRQRADVLIRELGPERAGYLAGQIRRLLAEPEPEETEAPEPPAAVGRVVVERRRVGAVTLQLEKVRCGKKDCKSCPHPKEGGYWYSYFRQGRKLKSRYVGKSLAKAVEFAERQTAEGRKVGGKAAESLR